MARRGSFGILGLLFLPLWIVLVVFGAVAKSLGPNGWKGFTGR
jgi:hypothetical protein